MTETSPGPSSARRYRILLVEPDDTTAARVTRELHRLDHIFHVQRALDRDEALRALLDNGPSDAALLDIDGPTAQTDFVSAATIHSPDTALVSCSAHSGAERDRTVRAFGQAHQTSDPPISASGCSTASSASGSTERCSSGTSES